MKNLKVFTVLAEKDRNSAIDIFRFFAVFSVVIWHYAGLFP